MSMSTLPLYNAFARCALSFLQNVVFFHVIARPKYTLVGKQFLDIISYGIFSKR